MKVQKEKLKNRSRGITLIALVITIIVLLILAGISISMLSGDNSILNRAVEAKEKNKESAVYEQLDLINIAWVSEEKTNKDANMENFLQEQKEKGEIDNFKDNEDGTYTITKDGYERTIKDTKTQYYTITKIYEDKTETQKVKAGDNTGKISHEEKEGYYFMGWSTDEKALQGLTISWKSNEAFSNVIRDVTVYPVYWSDEYLKVYCLFESSKGRLLLTTARDNYTYSKEIGFDYYVNGVLKSGKGSSVRSLGFSDGKNTTQYTAESLFNVPRGLLTVLEVPSTELQSMTEGTEIEVIPYCIRLDGSKITGTPKTYIYNVTELTEK